MFEGKKILITGGTGSWGKELTKQLLEKYNPEEIRIYSRGEHNQVQMRIKFPNEKKLKYYIGDVRDKNRLLIASKNVDYIFHLAALKHVPVCEDNPRESVLTNIMGTQNVVECSIENNVKKVIYVSTDKAVDPFNMYGVCKSCGEKIITSANFETDKTSFVCIRAGNVIGTNGSVIPLFKNQIEKNNELTITDERMSRYFFSLSQAINLIFKAAIDSLGGEIFVMKMPAAKITDLAEVMISELGNSETKTKIIGIRPGEKIYEVLVSKYEIRGCVEIGDYFVVLPNKKTKEIKEKYSENKKPQVSEFNSENTHILSKEEIKQILEREGWLEENGKRKTDYYGSNLSKSDLKNVFKAEGWQSNNLSKK